MIAAALRTTATQRSGAESGGGVELSRIHRSVAFTYNDPVVFLEYAIDVAAACRTRGIKAVAVTAGYTCPEPRAELFAHMDAANVDLKGFTERFYADTCAGHLRPVQETLGCLRHESR